MLTLSIQNAKTCLYSVKFESQLTNRPWKWKRSPQREWLYHLGQLLAKIKGLTRSNRLICKTDVGKLLDQWLEILKKLCHQKLVCRKASVTRSRLCQHCWGMLHAACNDARSHSNSFHCTFWHCWHIQSNYNVDSNTTSWIYMKIWLKALIYFVLQQASNWNFELKPFQIR